MTQVRQTIEYAEVDRSAFDNRSIPGKLFCSRSNFELVSSVIDSPSIGCVECETFFLFGCKASGSPSWLCLITQIQG